MKDFLQEDWLSIEDNTEVLTISPNMDLAVVACPFQIDRSVITDGFLLLTMLVKVEKYCSCSGEWKAGRWWS